MTAPDPLREDEVEALRYVFTREDEAYAVYRLRGYHDISDEDWNRCMPKDLLRLGLGFMVDHHRAAILRLDQVRGK
jgi:hypothetical protein